MSENVTPESEAARLYRHCRRAIGSNEPASYDCPHPDVDDVEAVIAAAEERGRRRGVEERDTLRAALRELRVNVIVASCDGSCLCGNDEWLTWHNGIIDAALAPRDSAPVCDAVVSSDPFREWRCGKPKGHEGPHSGEVPRDSGKEKP